MQTPAEPRKQSPERIDAPSVENPWMAVDRIGVSREFLRPLSSIDPSPTVALSNDSSAESCTATNVEASDEEVMRERRSGWLEKVQVRDSGPSNG